MAVIENKVSAATSGAGAAAIVANFVLWLLARYAFHNATPAEIVGVVNVSSASLGAFVLGYFARHTHTAEIVGAAAKDVGEVADAVRNATLADGGVVGAPPVP